MKLPQSALARLAAVVVLIAAGVLVVLVVAPDDQRAAPATLTIPVDGLDAGKIPDRVLEVPEAAVQAVAPRLEDQLRDETPTDAPAQELEGAERAAAQIAKTQLALPTAGATAGFAGCRTSFVRNQSSRRGVRPQLQVLHYTVSPNRPGWSDVDAVVALFNRASSQASSHFVIDSEGHCAYIVPIEQKAWTEAGGNSFGVSYEIIATGHESTYLAPAGIAKLRSVARDVSRRTGIPMRAGAVNGCAPARTGIVQHKDGGICWGGHVDIGPFNAATVIDQLIAGTVSTTDKITCRRLNYWRTHGRHHGLAEQRAVRRKNALTARGVTCTTHGPIRS